MENRNLLKGEPMIEISLARLKIRMLHRRRLVKGGKLNATKKFAPLEELAQESEEEIDISFVEGSQLIKMAVQADEEQEFMDEQEETIDSSDSDEGTALQDRQSEEQSGT